MKQKNLILLVVAVGCGLLAAFLTTQMSARPAASEQSEMLVAAKELTVGTKFEKDKLAEQIKKKKVNKNDIPVNAVTSEDELIGKTIYRSLRPDDFIAATDVKAADPLRPRPGQHLYTIKLPYEHVGPWVQAGRFVDVVCTHRPPGSTIVRHIKLLPEILVMAVDVDDKPKAGQGVTIINTVTVSASLDETKWLQVAQDTGSLMRLLVRDDDSEKFVKLSDKELTALFNDADPDKAEKTAKAPEPKKEDLTTVVQTVRYPVAVKEIKAGTVIDDEFIDKLTQVRPFAGPAPADVIIDLVAHKGKVLLQDVVADRYLNEAVLGEKVRNIPMAEVKTPEPVKTPVEVKKPVETWDTSLVTGSGTKTYRFVRFEKNGEWKMIGEVQADGTVNSSALPNLQPKLETPKSDSGN